VSNEVLQVRSLHSLYCHSITLWTSNCKMYAVDLPPFLEWENWKYKLSRLENSSNECHWPSFQSGIKLFFHVRKQDRRMHFAFVAYQYCFFFPSWLFMKSLFFCK